LRRGAPAASRPTAEEEKRPSFRASRREYRLMAGRGRGGVFTDARTWLPCRGEREDLRSAGGIKIIDVLR
jgi:hypothetical protein